MRLASRLEDLLANPEDEDRERVDEGFARDRHDAPMRAEVAAGLRPINQQNHFADYQGRNGGAGEGGEFNLVARDEELEQHAHQHESDEEEQHRRRHLEEQSNQPTLD